MTNKITLFAVLTALFFLSQPLWAGGAQAPVRQSGGGGHFVTEQRYVQRLAWLEDKYVQKYEVVIELEEGKRYHEFKREFTTLSTLVISLPLGNFRYHVIPYDFLDQPGEPSEWVTVNVIAPPVITSETPEQSAPSVPEKHVDFFLGAAWAPLFPVYGGIQQVFGYELYASGATLRFGLLYNNLEWLNPGMELSTSWYALNKTDDSDTMGIQAGVIGLNIVAQAWLPNRKMAFTLRAGGALTFQVGELNIGQYAYTMGGLAPQVNLEASFLWLVLKQCYFEAGLGFNHFINQDNYFGSLRPWLGAGWQFR